MTIDFIPDGTEEPEYMSIWDLTAADWLDVQLLAKQLHQTGYFGADFHKCYVAGFINWLEFNNKALIYDDAPNKTQI